MRERERERERERYRPGVNEVHNYTDNRMKRNMKLRGSLLFLSLSYYNCYKTTGNRRPKHNRQKKRHHL